jgi:hypothetical protein
LHNVNEALSGYVALVRCPFEELVMNGEERKRDRMLTFVVAGCVMRLLQVCRALLGQVGLINGGC